MHFSVFFSYIGYFIAELWTIDHFLVVKSCRNLIIDKKTSKIDIKNKNSPKNSKKYEIIFGVKYFSFWCS